MRTRIGPVQIRQAPHIRARHRLAAHQGVDVLPVIIVEQHVHIRVRWRIHRTADQPIPRKFRVVQRMRVQRGQVIHPDAVRAQQPAHLAQQRPAATVPDEVQWKFRQRMSAQFGNKIRAQQRRQHARRHLKRVVGIPVRRRAPIQLDDHRAGIGIRRRHARRSCGAHGESITARRRERDVVNREVRPAKSGVRWKIRRHARDPAIHLAVESVRDKGHARIRPHPAAPTQRHQNRAENRSDGKPSGGHIVLLFYHDPDAIKRNKFRPAVGKRERCCHGWQTALSPALQARKKWRSNWRSRGNCFPNHPVAYTKCAPTSDAFKDSRRTVCKSKTLETDRGSVRL